MTSTQIRQSFLDFFKSKQHTIVPSSSLMPDSPNLLFTNAGMNQFVPIFLGQVKCPYTPGRAADTQKCIRAGGKHNDLDDVGLDTYHHTFFEMLGNWSFGDYFKKEAIEWAWELVVGIWKFPPSRLYATIYNPDKAKGDPSERDEEAWNHWAEKFRSVGLDPAIHIVNGNKKDNFWMMGDTGPCGPCSELHVDLTPAGDTKGALVNKGDARCIEIWNLVFIQFNANPDGTFSPLPAKHVDTGMGFERVTSIMQGTKGMTDFANAKISNYETDIFRPIFDELERMSGKKYRSTLPGDAAGHPVSVVSAGQGGSGGIESLTSAGQEGGRRIADPMSGEKEGGHRIESPTSAGQGGVGRIATPPSVGQNEADGIASPASVQPDASGNPARGGSAQPDASYSPENALPAGKDEPYSHTNPKIAHKTSNSGSDDPIALDIAFRVIADHIRTLSFAIADGIQPGNTDRNYVLRRILRRAVRYGRTLGFHEPFFYKLVDVLAATMGDVFPEIRAKQQHVKDVLKLEEEAFNKTLDEGLHVFSSCIRLRDDFKRLIEIIEPLLTNVRSEVSKAKSTRPSAKTLLGTIQEDAKKIWWTLDESCWPWELVATPAEKEMEKHAHNVVKIVSALWDEEKELGEDCLEILSPLLVQLDSIESGIASIKLDLHLFRGKAAFVLYDTYGFPLDLTELMARERGLTVDVAGFNKLMDEQRARARAAQKKEVISLSQIETTTPTKFIGFDTLETAAKVVEVVSVKDKTAVILDASACYAEMGGQVGDTGELSGSGQLWRIVNTQKSGHTFLHFLADKDAPAVGQEVTLTVEKPRRNAIERHHTVTHLLHWALHEVVSREASQKGSFVGPDKLTFDFNSAALTPAQVADIEKLVNERIVENARVGWTEVPYSEVKSRKDVMQFFGDKYGDSVRVVQIGGGAGKLDGYSMELCGGTHTRATGEIGLFRIVAESAIAAGVRRIEAVAGLTAYDVMRHDRELIKTVAGKVSSPVHDLDKKIESLLAHQKELEKSLKAAQQREASNAASGLLAHAATIAGTPAIIHNLGGVDGDFLQTVADSLKGRFAGVIVLGGAANGAVALVAAVSPEFTAKIQAGKIIQTIAPIVGGKGGGKPDHARGGGKDAAKLDEALAKARSLLG